MNGEIDERELQQYLLGQLSPSGRERVVERLTCDEQYLQAAEAIEAELRDAFVRGELSPRDRRDFERHLLRTERQKDETALARHLADVLDRPLRAAPRRMPGFAWWSIAAAVALAILTGWVALENLALREELLAARHSIPPSLATRPLADSPSAPEVASLYLAGIVVRGAEALPELVLGPRTQLVRLEADPQLEGPLQAQLEDSSGAQISTQHLPPKSGSALRIWLPADGLTVGTYTLRVSSSSSVDESHPHEAVYRFRVTRKN